MNLKKYIKQSGRSSASMALLFFISTSISRAQEEPDWNKILGVKGVDLVYQEIDAFSSDNFGLRFNWHNQGESHEFVEPMIDVVTRDSVKWKRYRYDENHFIYSLTGVLIVDADKNTTPLKLDLGYDFFRVTDYRRLDTPLVDQGLAWSFGARAAIETDQSLDHTNATFGVKLGIYPDSEGNNVFTPAFYSTLDYVLVEDSSETALTGEKNDHVRFGLVADWHIPLGNFSSNKHMRRLTWHSTVTYSREFGRSAQWENLEFDESIKYMTELIYDAPDDQKWLLGQYDLDFFLRIESGKSAPIPKKEVTVTLGAKILKF